MKFSGPVLHEEGCMCGSCQVKRLSANLFRIAVLLAIVGFVFWAVAAKYPGVWSAIGLGNP